MGALWGAAVGISILSVQPLFRLPEQLIAMFSVRTSHIVLFDLPNKGETAAPSPSLDIQIFT